MLDLKDRSLEEPRKPELMHNALSESQLNSYKKIMNGQNNFKLNNNMQGSNSVSQLQGSTLYNTINHSSGKISYTRIIYLS